jgi:hypothetical protein
MRTPEQRAAANLARNRAVAKLRGQGYRFARKAATEAEIVATIQRCTGWPAPARGEAIDFMARFAALAVGEPTPSRQHDALRAPAYHMDRAMLAQAARAARSQDPLVHAVSKVDNWRTLGDFD